jgi:DnaJ-class molecular chaperone
MTRSSHHAVLGLDDYERVEAIHGAYRDLARRYHPARVGPGGEENFRIVAAAYRVLCDSSLRRFYADARFRRDGAAGHRAPRSISEFGAVGTCGPKPQFHVETLSLDRAAILASPNGEAMLARFARNFSGIGVPKSESAERLRVRFVVAARHRPGVVLLNLGLPVLSLCEACAGHCVTARVQCQTCNGGGFVESERTITLTFTADSAGMPSDLSLVPLGIHNLYLQAIVQIDPLLN